MSDPKLYKIGLREECFSVRIFWGWIVYAAFYAIVLLFTNFYVISVMVAYNGQESSFWVAGSVLYFGVVIVANLKLLQ